jgi:outer membrane lipoprotein SlyB
MQILKILLTVSVALLLPHTSSAEKVRQADKNTAIDISFGKLVDIERVEVKSKAAKGAAWGGMIGLASQHGGHGEELVAGAAVGALIGALVGKATSGHKYAFAFYIRRLDGRETKIISEQTGLEIGDCVKIEEGKHTGLQRVSQANCDPGYTEHRSDAEVGRYHQSNADACAKAKDDLLTAGDDADLEKLAYKVEVICNH